MSMMTLQTLNRMGSTKTQKSKCLAHKSLFFFQMKDSFMGYNLAQNSFLVGVTFK